MVHVVNTQSELELHFFYFGISRASSMVKLGIGVEEKFFAVCMAIHVAVCKNLSWFVSVFRTGGPQPTSEFVLRALDPDGDAKRHKIYTGSGNRGPTSSLRDRSCIPCTKVLVVGGYKLRERGNLS